MEIFRQKEELLCKKLQFTGYDEDGNFTGRQWLRVNEIRVVGDTCVFYGTDSYKTNHVITVQISPEGNITGLVEAWGLNTDHSAVYGPVASASIEVVK